MGRTDSAQPLLLDDRYLLGSSLGRGGMAEVFRARDTLLDRDVAVKRFFHDTALPDGELRRTSEIRLLASLSHPGVVAVFDAGRVSGGSADDFAYLVMEYVPGSTLASVIAEGALSPAQVADIGAQLSAALGYVHEHGVVHRDVKPANILLGPPLADGGRVAKLTDFGVARLLDGSRLTLTGATIGTANYLSPEQTTGAPLTGASDVYSLGLVLLEALTGTVAFPGHGVEAAVVRLSRQPVIPAQLGADWCALLAAMTARASADRPDISEVHARLGALSRTARPAGLPAASQPQPQPAPAVVKPHGARRRAAAFAGCAVAAAAVAAVLIGAASPTDVPGTPASGPQQPAARTATPTDNSGARHTPTSTKSATKTPKRQRPTAGTVATRQSHQPVAKPGSGAGKHPPKAPARAVPVRHGKPVKKPKPPKHGHGPKHGPGLKHGHGPHGPKHGPKPH